MLKNLSISRRIIVGFSVVVLCMVGLTATGVWRVEAINSHLTTINDLNSVKQRYAINFRGSVHDRAIALRDVVRVVLLVGDSLFVVLDRALARVLGLFSNWFFTTDDTRAARRRAV